MAPEVYMGRARFRRHLFLAGVLSGLFLSTVFVPDWLEVLGLPDLDNGDGSIERLVVAVLGLAAIGETALAGSARFSRSLHDDTQLAQDGSRDGYWA
jgi:hypothetical protein